MKNYDVDVNLNGKITFEVEAKNKEEAQRKVDELLEDLSVKEALEQYQATLQMKMQIKQEKSLER
ncbi:MAG: hypothetical protein E7313_04695 [Clostridiales bacterium]|nr:hypothetical protein [Clostridiales bacterium]